MRYIRYPISILIGILLALLAIPIAGGKDPATFMETVIGIFVLFFIVYGIVIYWLQRYRTIPYYNVMVKLRPDSAIVFNNRGLGYLRRGKYELALQDLQTAIQIKPNLAIAYANRGIVYLAIKQYEQALQAFNHAQELQPKNARMYLGRGMVYSATKRYREALEDFDRVLKLSSRALLADAYVGKANAYAHLKDYQLALRECERAITLASGKIMFYITRGIIHLSFEHFQEALEDFEHLIKSSSPSAQIMIAYGGVTKYQVVGQVNCAAVYLQLKEYQAAGECLEQAIALDPQFSRSYYARGIMYLWLNDMERARADIEQCWKMGPGGCPYGLVLAWLDLCQGKPSSEIGERLEIIGALDEMDYFARVSRGVARWIGGNYEEALVILQQDIDTELETGFAYFWSGMVCAALGRDEEAIAMVERALKEHLPPALLAPLRWLEEVNPVFYMRYGVPLLNGEKGEAH